MRAAFDEARFVTFFGAMVRSHHGILAAAMALLLLLSATALGRSRILKVIVALSILSLERAKKSGTGKPARL